MMMIKAGTPRSEILQTILLDPYDAIDIGSGTDILTISSAKNGGRKLARYVPGQSHLLWQSNDGLQDTPKPPQVTSLLPLDLDTIVAGYGKLCHFWQIFW
jgi:hypothetical protein